MGFKFAYLCDLLTSLEGNRTIKASTAARNSNPDIRVVARWFEQHEKRIHNRNTCRLALLSCLFPERRTDRVYWLQDTSLARVIGRCLLLGSSRREELDRWRVSGGGDLGQCVENVMRQAENQVHEDQEVTTEEIDRALNQIASRCRFSGPRVRRQHTAIDVERALGPLYRRLSSRDAKWLTRMILKNYFPVALPAVFVLRSFHFLLPRLLLFQDSFDGALSMLSSEPMAHFPLHPEPGLAKDLSVIALSHLTPQVGVKIGRPEFYKARSLEHCCQMVGRRRMSLERKYDGEYCQIHIDLTRSNPIQIFSKSGKDSTVDRLGVHEVLKRALRIGSADCRFSRCCILEGELLVWSDEKQDILEFHKLRKFISRSGTFIGTENDSPPKPHEHLMVIFFDILLLDDVICLKKPHRERRLLLKDAIQVIAGRANLAEQEIVDFSRFDGQRRLARAFTKAVVRRWEGYVLKACDEPYFTVLPTDDNPCSGRWIKLKKDYIRGLGDTVDFALIGARYESRGADKLAEIRKVLWTHFYIGCLVNAEAVSQLKAKPRFRVVDMIDQNSMNTRNMQYLNQNGEFYACNPETSHVFEVEYDQSRVPRMDVIFKTPFVVEMVGSGFDKPQSARYFTLRFPRIIKIHSDRSFIDAASFSDLQALAKEARSVPAEQTQEMERWTKRLKLTNESPSYISNISPSQVSTTSSSSSSFQSTFGSFRGSSPISETTKPLSGPVEKDAQDILPAGLIGRFQFQDEDTAANASSIHDMSPPTPPKSTIETSYADYEAKVPVALGSTERPMTLDSPLTSIPIYHAGSASFEKQSSTNVGLTQESPEAIFDLGQFLQRLRSQEAKDHSKHSNPHASSQGVTLGLVLIHNNDLPSLSTQLYEISRVLSRALRSGPSLFPPNGKIFLLSSDILRLGNGPGDRRFCLRGTWENIGKAYFFASLTWEIGSSSLTPAGKKTTGKAVGVASDLPRGQQQQKQQLGDSGVGITISFDRDVLKTLGEFTSIEPPLHVNDGL